MKLLKKFEIIYFPCMMMHRSCWLASTRSKPKIADYSFITLQPQLGDIYVYDKEFVIVDLPGLIENARWACDVWCGNYTKRSVQYFQSSSYSFSILKK